VTGGNRRAGIFKEGPLGTVLAFLQLEKLTLQQSSSIRHWETIMLWFMGITEKN